MFYIISLKKPFEKKRYLKSHDIDAFWIKGINGKNLDKKVIQKHFTKFYSNYGPRGSIGCALSHLKTWKKFLKSGKDYCIIFEDDVILKKRFIKRFERALENVPSDYDILYLGSFGGIPKSNFFTIIFDILQMSNPIFDQINKYISKPKVALGAHAYVLSRKGAEKLVTFLDKNINNHIDYCIQNLASKDLIKTYTVTPRLAYQTSTDTLKSSNSSNLHPFIITKSLSHFYLDKMVRASYIATVSIMQIYNIYITPITLFFFILSCILAFFEISLQNIILYYIIISLPDIFQFNLIYTLFHLLILIIIPLFFYLS
jgi:GR25 family glycosyltransferase involved in LPS biosynthesis